MPHVPNTRGPFGPRSFTGTPPEPGVQSVPHDLTGIVMAAQASSAVAALGIMVAPATMAGSATAAVVAIKLAVPVTAAAATGSISAPAANIGAAAQIPGGVGYQWEWRRDRKPLPVDGEIAAPAAQADGVAPVPTVHWAIDEDLFELELAEILLATRILTPADF